MERPRISGAGTEEQELIVLHGKTQTGALITLESEQRQNRKQSKRGTEEQVNRVENKKAFGAFDKCKTREECGRALAALVDDGMNTQYTYKEYKKRMAELELRERRIAAGLSMRKLAERSGVSTQTIYRIEGGHTRHPTKAVLRLLREALGIDEEATL